MTDLPFRPHPVGDEVVQGPRVRFSSPTVSAINYNGPLNARNGFNLRRRWSAPAVLERYSAVPGDIESQSQHMESRSKRIPDLLSTLNAILLSIGDCYVNPFANYLIHLCKIVAEHVFNLLRLLVSNIYCILLWIVDQIYFNLLFFLVVVCLIAVDIPIRQLSRSMASYILFFSVIVLAFWPLFYHYYSVLYMRW